MCLGLIRKQLVNKFSRQTNTYSICSYTSKARCSIFPKITSQKFSIFLPPQTRFLATLVINIILELGIFVHSPGVILNCVYIA